MSNKISKWLNKKYKEFGEYLNEEGKWNEYWKIIVVVVVLGIVGDMLGWAFFLFIPAFLIIVGYFFKKKYKNTLK